MEAPFFQIVECGLCSFDSASASSHSWYSVATLPRAVGTQSKQDRAIACNSARIPGRTISVTLDRGFPNCLSMSAQPASRRRHWDCLNQLGSGFRPLVKHRENLRDYCCWQQSFRGQCAGIPAQWWTGMMTKSSNLADTQSHCHSIGDLAWCWGCEEEGKCSKKTVTGGICFLLAPARLAPNPPVFLSGRLHKPTENAQDIQLPSDLQSL